MASQKFIDEAVRGAAVCVQWQASDISERGDGYPISDGGDDFTDAVEDVVRPIVEDFIDLVERAGNAPAEIGRYTLGTGYPELFGHDFVLSANGHGTGFWDRGLGDVGDRLHFHTHGFSIDAYFELWDDEADGEEHCSDEVKTLLVNNTFVMVNGELAPEEYSE